MAGSKLANVWHPVGHLSADGVGIGESGSGGYMLLDVLDDMAEAVQGLGRLAVEANVAREVQPCCILHALDDDGCTFRLSHESEYFCMTGFAENDYLTAVFHVCLILPPDAFLQMEDNGTGGIDEVDVVGSSLLVGGWRFTMSTQQHVGITQLGKLLMVYGDKPELAQAFHLLTVVNDISQTVELSSLLQLLFSFSDGAGDAEAEAGTGVDFNRPTPLSFPLREGSSHLCYLLLSVH